MHVRGIKAILKNRLHKKEVYCTAEYWNSRAEEYAGYSAVLWLNNNLNHYYHREHLDVIKKYLPDINGASVLDMGCGSGRISRNLAKRGAKVTGIDFSTKAIEIAKRQTSGDNPHYRVESIFELNEKDIFDIIVILGVLCDACKNRAELFDVMNRLYKSLKPRGKILLIEPIHKGTFHRVLNMDIREFLGVVIEAGFEIKAITNLHFLLMHLLLAYFTLPKFITATGYYFGKWIMNLFGNKAWGDYKVIYASVQRKE